MKNNSWRKIPCVFSLVVCMMFSLLPVPVLANPANGEVTDATPAIPADAIYLSTAEDVLALAENCRVNTWSVGKIVVLNSDIDMTEMEFTGIPTFGGTFLGQGFMIKGINLTGDGSVAGFFRYLQESAVVDKLVVEGIVQPGGSKSTVGGIAGNNAGTIRGCSFNGTVSGYEQIGGIAGINETAGLIENCTVSGMVYGSHFVGGFVGENHGVIRQCTNQAEINTKSVQNSVSIEDITLESLMNTESADVTTDIGGIVGISSGVVRSCVNHGEVGYQSMSYNIGGIAGTQNGYVVDCVNHADIQGRKEVGGIAGHMEPNIVLHFTEDSLQELADRMDDLDASLQKFESSMQNTTSDIENQVFDIENGLEKMEEDLEILSQPIDAETGEVDVDKLTAAKNDLGTSLNDVYTKSINLQRFMKSSTVEMENQMDEVVSQLEQVMDTLDTMDDGINLTMEDISGNDTDADTVGKVSNCVNYGSISGDFNIGGIAGVMAEEGDLDEYEDTSIYGDFSLNITGQVRVVIRDCKNQGTISANKNYVGGIVGQMIMGAVLESVNTGSLDAVNADYVGGIAGSSHAIIRNSSSKSIIAGDTYVGGIAGFGDEVNGCNAFVSIKAYTEKAGAVLGFTDELPEGSGGSISGNYYFVEGKDLGGIDGISYAGAADKLDLAGFLQLPDLDETLKTAKIRFIVEGQEDVVLSVNAGDTLSMDAIPTLSVEEDSEYAWQLVPSVTSEVLGMGETAAVEYLSEESLSNILFDQTYEVSYSLKDTVIQGASKDTNNRTLILAEGSFAKNTVIEIMDMLSAESAVNGTEVLENWQVALSNTGVTRLHYLISEEVNVEAVKLLVKDASGKWAEREFVMDGSYIVFDFGDGESGFALAEDMSGYIGNAAVVGIAAVMLLVGMVLVLKKRKRR